MCPSLGLQSCTHTKRLRCGPTGISPKLTRLQYHSPQNVYKLIPLPVVFFCIFFFVIFTGAIRCGVDIAQKPNKSSPRFWIINAGKYAFGNFYEMNSSQDFFAIANILVRIDGIPMSHAMCSINILPIRDALQQSLKSHALRHWQTHWCKENRCHNKTPLTEQVSAIFQQRLI